MKKVISLVLALIMVFTMSASALAASVNVSANKTVIEAGESVDVTLTLDETLDNIIALAYNLYFDADLFTLTNSTNGTVNNVTQISNLKTDAKGSFYSISYLDTASVGVTLPAGTLYTLTFTANEDVAVGTETMFELVKDAVYDNSYSFEDIGTGTGSPVSVTIGQAQPEQPALPFASIVTEDDVELEVREEGTVFYAQWMEVPKYIVSIPEGTEYIYVYMNEESSWTPTYVDPDYFNMISNGESADGDCLEVQVDYSDEYEGLEICVIQQNGWTPVFALDYEFISGGEEDTTVPVTKLTFWSSAAEPITEITVAQGEAVDAIACCTPMNTTENVVLFSSSDESIFTVKNAEVTADDRGQAPTTVQGVKAGTATLTATSKSNPEIVATCTVIVTCKHIGTATTPSVKYTQNNDGTHTVVTSMICECGETAGTTTEIADCTDENGNGECDACGAAVEAPSSKETVIFDEAIHGSWGQYSTTYLSKLLISGVSVKKVEWKDTSGIITLAKGTPADAAITFSYEGLAGNGGKVAFAVDGDKSKRTINLVNGEAEVEVRTCSSVGPITGSAQIRNITFLTEGAEVVPVESITITPENPRVTANGSLQLTANILPENATVKGVNWSIAADSTAMTITESGVVKGQTMGMGRYYTVTATSQSNPEVKATCEVYLDWKQEDSIALDQNSLSMKIGDEATLNATVNGQNFVTNTSVTWTSSDESVATVSGGKVIAVGGGTATITATSYYGLTAECVVTVEGETVEEPTVNGLTASVEGNATVEVGDTAQIELFVESDDAQETYNAFRFEVSYDAEKLTFNGADFNADADYNVSDRNGALIIDGYGDSQTVSGDAALVTLNFTGKAAGEAKVAIEEAYANDRGVAINENVQPINIKEGSSEATVTVNKAKETFTVTFAGSGKDDASGASTVTEGETYAFTVDKQDGYTYTITAIMGGVKYELNGGYTIENVNGNIVITVEREKIGGGTDPEEPTKYPVTLPDGVTGDPTATEGEDYPFTVPAGSEVPNVTIGGKPYEIGEGTVNPDGSITYIIPGNQITGAIVVELPEMQINVTVNNYFEYDGGVMKLILAEAALADGKVLTYQGNAMYWSEVYNAYACLVPTNGTLDETTAAAEIAVVDGSKVTITYDGDVNKTGIVDVNDAQLTYDIYNAEYSDFSQVSMEKMLRADVNNNKTVDTQDVTANVAIYR